jgi:hypothetical protein
MLAGAEPRLPEEQALELKRGRTLLLPIARAMTCNRKERPQRTRGQGGKRPQQVTLWGPSGLSMGDEQTTSQEVILYEVLSMAPRLAREML